MTTRLPVTSALRQPRRASRLLVSGCTRSTSTPPCAAATRLRLHALYVNLAVRRNYSSPGHTCSTSTSSCTASTRLHSPGCRDLPRLLRLHRASGCLGTSRGSSCGSSHRSSSTTLPRPGSSSTTPPRVRVPRHVARLVMRLVAPFVVNYSASPRLVVDYSTACPGASARRAARHVARCAAHRRLLRLRRASGCLGTSRGPSHGSSSTTPCAATSSCGHAGSTSATPCVVTTCLAATLAVLRVRRAPPQRRLPVTSRRPFISTSFPN
jgi:hypothetical protein